MKPVERRGRFFNDVKETVLWRIAGVVKTFFYVFFLECLRRRKQFLPKNFNLSVWLKKEKSYPRMASPAVTWLGHASFLVQMENLNILTDPVFGDPSRLYPRYVEDPLLFDELPSIDIVVLSHNHFDHFDPKSLKMIAQRDDPVALVPYGDKKRFENLGFSRVHELVWGQKAPLLLDGNSLECTFLPAHHWSGTGLLDINKSFWGGWFFKGKDRTIFFAGDTAYSSHFSWIKQHVGKVDIALLPIGPLHPSHLMLESHTSAHEAVKAFEELQAEHFIPMHWGTFRPANDSFQDPINQLRDSWNAKKRDDKHLHIVKFGERVHFE